MDLTSAQRRMAFIVIVLALAGLGAFLLWPRPSPAASAPTAHLTEAAGVVRRFSSDYATYSYTESAGSYVGRMRGLVTPELAATLAQDYATPGVAQTRTQQKQTATGSGVITALRAFGASSLTFLVTLNQKTYSTPQSGKTTAHTASGDYAITIARSGSGWQVNDIQLASAGNSWTGGRSSRTSAAPPPPWRWAWCW